MDASGPPKAWQEAFETHKILDVRTIEKQLRTGISRDKEKLRVLVGSNYRELLSTADQIITLGSETKIAETNISSLSQNCKPPAIEPYSRNLSLHVSTAAQLRFLSKCILAASTELRDGSILPSAELAVISRLLVKHLGSSKLSLKGLEQLRGKDILLRKRLLRIIDVRLAHPSSTNESLVEAICAYCLITSASSSDAILHFRQLRLDNIRRKFDDATAGPRQVTETLQYLVASILMLQSLHGRSVGDMLLNLQRQPILAYPHIATLESLNLDQIRSMIPQDILAFTPYIKRVELAKHETNKIIDKWSSEASQIFAKGYSASLKMMKSIEELLILRNEMLKVVLPVYFTVNARDDMLGFIRQSTDGRIAELVAKHATKLQKIERDITGRTPTTKVSLSVWDSTTFQFSMNAGSAPFLQQLQIQRLGTEEGLERDIRKLKKWAASMSKLKNHIQIMRIPRWQDIIEEPDEEEEAVATRVISQLSIDDPKHFEDSLSQTIRQAITEFYNQLQHNASLTGLSADIGVEKLASLIRALRESTRILHQIMPDLPTASQTFTKLYEALTAHVIRRITSTFTSDSKEKSTAFNPPNDLPSPLTISVLREVCHVMSEVGGLDVWSSGAVEILKSKLLQNILSEESKSFYTTTQFDHEYLQAALETKDQANPKRDGSDNGQTATIYWNRTKLLFGMLG